MVAVSAPLVSVVTPSLNQGRYLREAIESVRAQTYSPIEHVVVDGGSTDETLDILSEYDHLRWVSEPDRGQSHALNKGFARAAGEIFGWLNADDAYEPHAVAEGVRALTESGAGLVYADVTRVNDDRIDPRRIRSRPRWDLWTELNEGNGVYSPSVFFTREAFEAAGCIDDSLHFSMDYDLWLRIGKRFGVQRVDAVWSMQRYHDASKTISRMDAFWPERLAVSRRHGGRLVSPLLIRRYAGAGRLAHLLNSAAAAMYMAKERRFRTLMARLRAALGGG
jgi:glycosyltransferase involved in cell wall biosynthesis